MGIKTEIGYCDSTVNPLIGCDGCELHKAGDAESHCYAAGLVGRYAGLKGWPASFDDPQFFPGRIEKACRWSDLTGKDRPDKPWLNGMPRVIFPCDLSDPFSTSVDPEIWLTPALPLIGASSHIWMFLTKRPGVMASYSLKHPLPKNVWVGTSLCGPESYRRVVELGRIDASVRFLSCEPLLAELDLEYPKAMFPQGPPMCCDGRECGCMCKPIEPPLLHGINLVIIGGESGPGARPCDIAWVRSLMVQCKRNAVKCFVKQLGARPQGPEQSVPAWVAWLDSKGGNWEVWPDDLRVREMPEVKSA